MPVELSVIEVTSAPVELTITETSIELEQAHFQVVLESASTPGPQGPPGAGGVVTADYLVGTAQAGLTSEIVVGTTPNGELGGTWGAITVDALHSGSTHAAVQAAAEATAAGALAAHTADTTAVHGIADTSALALTANHPSNAAFDDHSARHENGGADEISIAGLDGTSVELASHLADAADAHDASAISFVPAGTIAATDVQAAIEEVAAEAGATGAPTTADYLVGTTQGGLSAEIVVGTSPGGELGGTWASPTVDATHSGSSHAAVQAAAEATAAAALAAHTGDATDAHDASAISIADAANDFTATEVEGALAELQTADEADEAALAAHLADTTDAHDATAISFAAGFPFSADDVQEAVNEMYSIYITGIQDLSKRITWETRATNTVLTEADTAKAIAITAAITQTIADELTEMWVILHNATTDGSVVTIDPVGTIDGAATLALQSGEARFLFADASDNIHTIPLFVNHKARHEDGGLDEMSIAGLAGTPLELTNHLSDATDAHDASAISVVSTTLSGTGTDVQASLEEIDNLLDDHSARHENGGADAISIAGLAGTPTELTNHLNDATDAHDASAISIFDAANDFTATNVEDALAELQTADEASASVIDGSGPVVEDSFGWSGAGGSPALIQALADYSQVTVWTMDGAGFVTDVVLNLDGNGPGSGTGLIKALIYEDSGGVPGALLGVSAEVSVVNAQAQGDVTFAFATPIPLTAADYFVGFHGGTNADNIRFLSDATIGKTRLYDIDAYAGGPADPYGTADGSDANSVLAIVNYIDWPLFVAGGGSGAPTTVDYLVGTASGGLSAEIVVGTTPGGELGGTWASPTVDATHSGSTHAAVQAAAEATAAAALAAYLTESLILHMEVFA